MKPLFTDKCPFVNPPNIKEKIQWVRPKLVCEVEYAELTADDQLRQTTFLGWRDDKKPKEIVLERYWTTRLFDAANGATDIGSKTDGPSISESSGMKRMLIAISALFTMLLVCPKPTEAARVVVTVGPGYYAPGYYWGSGGYRYYSHPYWRGRYWRHHRWYYR